MAWKRATYRYTGKTALLMHDNKLANPFDEHSQQIHEIKLRRGKTLDDHREIARLEFLGGGYWDQDRKPIIPAKVIYGLLTGKGGVLKAHNWGGKRGAIRIIEDALLEYEGPTTAEELWENPNFRDQRMVKASGTTLRTRPRFDEWSAVVTIEFDDSVFTRKQMDSLMAEGGGVGIGDARALGFGRFTADPVSK